MFDLSAIMSCLTICLDTTTLARLRVIVPAMLAVMFQMKVGHFICDANLL